jgi:hypothetical protein
MMSGMSRQASFFFAIATLAFGSLGTQPCEPACIDQVDSLFLETDSGDSFVDISATGACHLSGSWPQAAQVQVDSAGTCVVTGATLLTGEFRFERTVEWFTTNCGTMALGVRYDYLRRIKVSNHDAGVAPDAI